MSQDHSFRSRFRSAKASRMLRNKRRQIDSRPLRVEQLEQRSLLAGLIGEKWLINGPNGGSGRGSDIANESARCRILGLQVPSDEILRGGHDRIFNGSLVSRRRCKLRSIT